MKLKQQINNHVSKQLIRLRELHGYKQSHLAEILGVSRASYVNMEAGRQTVTTVNLYTLCCIFNCSASDILPAIAPIVIEKKEVKVKVVRVKKKFVQAKVKLPR